MKRTLNDYFPSTKRRTAQCEQDIPSAEAATHNPVEQSMTPLAERQRPKRLEDVIGQEQAIGKGTMFYDMVMNDSMSSTILYGPPGTGKTTIATIVEHMTSGRYIKVSATTTGKKELKEIMQEAAYRKKQGGKTVLFVDEIHSLNKFQQDTFLPFVENGTIILLGATTENPSFEINNALMSRCHLVILRRLDDKDIMQIIKKAMVDEYSGLEFDFSEETLRAIAVSADGDARNALNTVEQVVNHFKAYNKNLLLRMIEAERNRVEKEKKELLDDDSKLGETDKKGENEPSGILSVSGVVPARPPKQEVTEADYIMISDDDSSIANLSAIDLEEGDVADEQAQESGGADTAEGEQGDEKTEMKDDKVHLSAELVMRYLERVSYQYDRQGEEHYNIISALHKSIRGSDENASVYWLMRMINSGENPDYIGRRLLRIASEDIGLADPNALVIANSAFQATHVIGYPDCDIILSECAMYLARAPKSIATYCSMSNAKKYIKETGSLPVPMHIRNAPTELMGKMGYGHGYIYPPSVGGVVNQRYLPNRAKDEKFVVYDRFVRPVNPEDIACSKTPGGCM